MIRWNLVVAGAIDGFGQCLSFSNTWTILEQIIFSLALNPVFKVMEYILARVQTKDWKILKYMYVISDNSSWIRWIYYIVRKDTHNQGIKKMASHIRRHSSFISVISSALLKNIINWILWIKSTSLGFTTFITNDNFSDLGLFFSQN